MNWDDFRFLLALHRAGSLSAAARDLKVEPSTASRRLSALEKALGVQLAARTPEGLVMNDAGELAAELAASFDDSVEQLLRRVGGEDSKPEGLVRLSTTEAMAPFFMRGLSGLAEFYPKIRIEFVLSSAAMDLRRREADLAVRLFREQNPALIIRKVGDVGWSVYASEHYLDARGMTTRGQPDEQLLIGQSVIGYRGAAGRSSGARWLVEHSPPEAVVMQGDGVLSVADAVASGIGVSVLPCMIAADKPGLVRLTPSVVASTEAFLVIPPDHRSTTRVRVVMDALVDLFEQERDALGGQSLADAGA